MFEFEQLHFEESLGPLLSSHNSQICLPSSPGDIFHTKSQNHSFGGTHPEADAAQRTLKYGD